MNIQSYQNPASSISTKSERNGKNTKNASTHSEEKRGITESNASDTELTLVEWKEQKRKQEKEEKEREKEDKFRKTLEELAAQKRAFQEMLRKKKNLSYDATADMSALTSAVNVGQVKSIAARLYLKANSLKLQARDSKEAAAALAVVKQVLKKTEVKISRLKDEEILIVQQKRAERKRELEYAEKVKKELEKRRKLRTAQEQSDLAESYSGGSKYHYSAPFDMTLLPSSDPPTADPIMTEGTIETGGSAEIASGGAGASVNIVV